jgi:hypothetical protein
MSAVEGNDAAARKKLKKVLTNRFGTATDYAYVDALSN